MIVVGAGHAGIEAAYTASKMGCSVLMTTFNIDNIGKLSCNPAIGGLAKSHLVKEVDIFGGLIARLADRAAIQYRILNRSKGRAVRATRAQVGRVQYNLAAKKAILDIGGIEVLEAEAESVIVKNNKAVGISTNLGDFLGKTVVLCPGTFLDGLVHIGFRNFPQGRMGEPASVKLYGFLKKLDFGIKHFKTGTCPRLDRSTLDFSCMQEQKPDKNAGPFSFFSKSVNKKQISCYITFTNSKTHRIIKRNLKYSPLYQGVIKGKSVRYCPSLEDKIVKFSSKPRHQIFIEPEGLDTIEVYPNGISNSLPYDAQYEFIHSIEGLESARIIKPGYGIEHAVIDARRLLPTLESKKIKNLFFAGQINGTTGYEEAAAQGLAAGINAALKARRKPPYVFSRYNSFIGLLIDELTSKGTDEPYRMFTSRSELRLSIRQDNAFLRLYKDAHSLGLMDKKTFEAIRDKEARIKREMFRLKKTKLFPSAKINTVLKKIGEPCLKSPVSFYDLLKRPNIQYKTLAKLSYSPAELDAVEFGQIEIEAKYEGFIKREKAQLREIERINRVKIPAEINYNNISGLSKEIKEKLSAYRPRTLKEAFNIAGVTAASISLLLNHISRLNKTAGNAFQNR